jgi:general secretion pathway protein G
MLASINKRSHRGFTLIELLVVIAIIGILSSVVLASLNSARQKGRDTRRIADIKQLQLALELSYDANSVYPATLASLATDGYISVIPTDPTGAANGYGYVQLSSGADYVLGATLEQAGHTVLDSDYDGDQAITIGTGAATNCNAATGEATEVVFCATP